MWARTFPALFFQVLPALHSLLLFGCDKGDLVFHGAERRGVMHNNLRISTLPLQCV